MVTQRTDSGSCGNHNSTLSHTRLRHYQTFSCSDLQGQGKICNLKKVKKEIINRKNERFCAKSHILCKKEVFSAESKKCCTNVSLKWKNLYGLTVGSTQRLFCYGKIDISGKQTTSEIYLSCHVCVLQYHFTNCAALPSILHSSQSKIGLYTAVYFVCTDGVFPNSIGD